MAIISVPPITVSGMTYPVVNLDFSMGQGAPSSMQLDFVNSSGVYVLPNLDWNTPQTISVEGITPFNMYAVKTDLTQSGSGKLLSVKYVDESVILDKVFVGLYNRQGKTKSYDASEVTPVAPPTSISAGDILILGNEVDPCAELIGPDPDRVDFIADPCHPCMENGDVLRERLLDCQKAREQEILEVRYRFSDLLTCIQTMYDGNVESNENYHGTYIGTLRTVLDNWCADYGYSYFWNPHTSKINFVDMSEGIQMNSANIDNNCNVLSKSVSESIEGTKSTGVIATFAMAVEPREYDCDHEWARRLKLMPLTLEHIVPLNAPIMNYYGTYLRLQSMAMMTYYSPELRDCYAWYIKYGIKTAVDCLAYKTSGEQLKLLGDMKIIEVFSKDGENAKSKEGYNLLLEKLPDDERALFEARKGYFFVAEKKNETAQFHDLELTLAETFGKYFVRKYGKRFGVPPTISAPDGTVSFYPTGEAVQFDFVDRLPDNFTKFKSYLNDNLLDIDPVANEAHTSDSFFMLEKNQIWSPQKDSADIVTMKEDMKILSIVEREIIDLLDVKGQSYSVYELPTSGTGLDEAPRFAFAGLSLGDHPEDFDIDQATQQCGVMTHYGLQSRTAYSFAVKTPNVPSGIRITTPPQGFLAGTQTDESDEIIYDGGQHAGYLILLCGDGSIKTIIDQKRNITIASNIAGSNVSSLDINTRDVTTDVLKLLEREGIHECKVKEDDIEAMLLQFTDSLATTSVDTFVTENYTIAGLPAPNAALNVVDGLDSLSIRVSESGVETSLSYSNKAAMPKSGDLTYRLMELAAKGKKRANLPYAKREERRPEGQEVIDS